jgi:hypothetical protein
MSAALHLFELKDIANNIKQVSADKIWSSVINHTVQSHADEALKHLGTAEEHFRSFQTGNSSAASGVSSAVGEAVHHIASAHQLVSDKLREESPADVLQVAHLGEAHFIHQNILDELNEGLKNGS